MGELGWPGSVRPRCALRPRVLFLADRQDRGHPRDQTSSGEAERQGTRPARSARGFARRLRAGVEELPLAWLSSARARRATPARRRAARRGRARRRRARVVPFARGVVSWRCRRRPSASSSSQPRSRGHSRSSASCATSTVPALTVSRRRSASRATTARDVLVRSVSSSASGDPPAHDAARVALADQPQQHAARDGLLRGVELAERLLREPRDRAAHAAGALVGGVAQAPPSRRCHSSSSAVDSSGSAPGSSLDVGHQRVDELRLDAQAGALRRALDGPAQLVAPHRAHEYVVGGQQLAQLGIRRAAPVEVGADREHDDGASPAREPSRASSAMNAARSSSSRQAVNVSSNWSTASTTAVAVGAARRRALSSRSGCSPGPDEHLRPVLAAGQHAVRQGGQQAGPHDRGLAAARRAHDAEQRRADEPGDELGDEPLAAEEVRRVGDLERGEALERAHHAARSSSPSGASRSRAACSSTTSPASSASIERSSARPAAARPATAPTRRAASRRAHWLASSWTRRGTPPLASSSHSAGTSSRGAAGA